MKLLSPKKFKYKKLHNIFYKTNFIKLKFITTYTKILIYSINTGYLTAKHLETFRLFLRKILKTGTNIKILINTFPDLSRTKKSAGLRMGKGKGKPYIWVSKLKRGASLFEILNSFKYVSWDTEFFNLPIEYDAFFKNKSLRFELPFSERLDLETSFSEIFRLAFIKEHDNNLLVKRFDSFEHYIFSYFLRTNSLFSMSFFINYYIIKNFQFGSLSNRNFFFRDSVILERLFKKGLKKLPLKTNYITLHNKFFLYN